MDSWVRKIKIEIEIARIAMEIASKISRFEVQAAISAEVANYKS